jgi:hypothetical protein
VATNAGAGKGITEDALCRNFTLGFRLNFIPRLNFISDIDEEEAARLASD